MFPAEFQPWADLFWKRLIMGMMPEENMFFAMFC